jgi:hypothetical protein
MAPFLKGEIMAVAAPENTVGFSLLMIHASFRLVFFEEIHIKIKKPVENQLKLYYNIGESDPRVTANN